MNRLGSRLAGAALIASAAAVVSASGTASAMFHRGPTLTSGDERATAHPARRFDLGCRGVRLGGSRVDVTAFADDGHRRLTVTSVPEGVRLTGIVVRSALAYNVYLPAALGALPYQDLHSPIYRGDHPALVLGWFACGIDTLADAVTPAPTRSRRGAPVPTGGHGTGHAPPARPEDPSVSAEVTLGPAAPPASIPPGAGADSRPGTGAPGEHGRPDGSGGSGGAPATSAAPGAHAAATPPAADATRLRKAAQVDLGASLYLALAMLLVVTGGLLLVAPRRLGSSIARLRHRAG